MKKAIAFLTLLLLAASSVAHAGHRHGSVSEAAYQVQAAAAELRYSLRHQDHYPRKTRKAARRMARSAEYFYQQTLEGGPRRHLKYDFEELQSRYYRLQRRLDRHGGWHYRMGLRHDLHRLGRAMARLERSLYRGGRGYRQGYGKGYRGDRHYDGYGHHDDSYRESRRDRRRHHGG